MSRKVTAGQLAQLGQFSVDGIIVPKPSREEMQLLLGNPGLTKQLSEANGALLGAALVALRAGGAVPTASDLLELVTTVSLPAIEAFSAKNSFRKDGQAPRGVRIGWLGDNFTRAFLSGTGKNEIDVPAADFRVQRLRRNSVDPPIIKELGGEEVVETSLAHVFELMAGQPTGQSGTLLTNGYANIFYVRDSAGTLWAVSCRWYASYQGWSVEAFPVLRPFDWGAGRRVVSR